MISRIRKTARSRRGNARQTVKALSRRPRLRTTPPLLPAKGSVANAFHHENSITFLSKNCQDCGFAKNTAKKESQLRAPTGARQSRASIGTCAALFRLCEEHRRCDAAIHLQTAYRTCGVNGLLPPVGVAMTIRRECLSPCRPRRGLLHPLRGFASSILYLIRFEITRSEATW